MTKGLSPVDGKQHLSEYDYQFCDHQFAYMAKLPFLWGGNVIRAVSPKYFHKEALFRKKYMPIPFGITPQASNRGMVVLFFKKVDLITPY